MTRARVAVMVGVFASAYSVAAAEPTDRRPDGWLVRATPGFGYSWDDEPTCALDGRMFAGGFSGGYFVAPGLLVGAAVALNVNTLPPAASCGDGSVRFALAMVVGPAVDWYPRPDHGLHVLAAFGYAEIDDGSMPDGSVSGRGIGGIAAIGYDWLAERSSSGTAIRIGTQLQVSAQRTFTANAKHSTLVPALLVTFAFN